MSCEQVPRALWAYRISITQQLSYSGEKANKQGCNQHLTFFTIGSSYVRTRFYEYDV